jgi:hypothetical protein
MSGIMTDASCSVTNVTCTTMTINSSSINSSVTINDISDCLYSDDSGITITRPTSSNRNFSVTYSGGYKVTSDHLDLTTETDPDSAPTLTLEEDTTNKIWNITQKHSGSFRQAGERAGQIDFSDTNWETIILKQWGYNRSSGVLFSTAGVSAGIFMRDAGGYPQFTTLGFQNEDGEGRWDSFAETYGTTNSTVDVTGNYISMTNNSDVRLKTNIIPLNNALKSINKLNIVQYDKYRSLKRDSTSTFAKSIGVIAQEVEKSNDPILVSSVGPADDFLPYSVNYQQLFTVSIKALQELHKEYKEYKELVYKNIYAYDFNFNKIDPNKCEM